MESETNTAGNKITWTVEEQNKIDKALREAELQEEIKRKLREKRWSVGTDK